MRVVVNEEKYIKVYITCKKCKGKKYFRLTANDGSAWIVCPNCNGEGMIEWIISKPAFLEMFKEFFINKDDK